MSFFLHLISVISFSLPIALGYTFVFGRGKIMHYGPLGVSLIAAYGSFLTLEATGSFAAALAMGIVAACGCSALFWWMALRLEPDGLGILSIAMHLILINIVLNWQGFTHGALGIDRIPRLAFMQSPAQFAFWSGFIALCWLAFFLWLDRTALARQLSALAEQEWHAASLGIKRWRVHLLAFLVLAVATASDNFLHPQYFHLLYPTDYLFPMFVALVMWTVAGKPGSMWGAALATTFLILLNESIRFVSLPGDVVGPLRLLMFGVILLGAVWWRRDVLFPKRRTI